MKIIDVKWFSGNSSVGIVKVEDDYDGVKYYIGSPPPFGTEQQDIHWITDWGSTFPLTTGDHLFSN